MAVSKASRSAGRKTIPHGRILRFPQARGKTIELVELSVSSDQYTIDIRFEDKTVLSFDVKACVGVFPELLDRVLLVQVIDLVNNHTEKVSGI